MWSINLDLGLDQGRSRKPVDLIPSVKGLQEKEAEGKPTLSALRPFSSPFRHDCSGASVTCLRISPSLRLEVNEEDRGRGGRQARGRGGEGEAIVCWFSLVFWRSFGSGVNTLPREVSTAL